MARYDIYTDRVPIGSSAWVAIMPLHGCVEYSYLVSGGTIMIKGFSVGGKAFLDAAAAVDAGAGKVQLAAALNGFSVGDSVTIVGTVNYDGVEVLTAGSTADIIEITATYVAESIPATAYVTGERPAQSPAGVTNREDYRFVGKQVSPGETIFYAKSLTGTAYLEMTYKR